MKTNPDDAVSSDFSSESDYRTACGGLTKREYFAAMALQGLCANSQPITDKMIADYMIETGRRCADATVNAYLAEHAVIYADALIAELNKEK